MLRKVRLFATVGSLLKVAGLAWIGDNAPRMGAALAYYTLFSVAPVLVVVVWFAGTVIGHATAQAAIVNQFHSLMGTEASTLIESIVRSSDRPNVGIPSAVIGFIAILLGASGAFNELQDAFDTIWKVERKGESFWLTTLLQRLFSLGLVAATGFMLLTSLILGAFVTVVQSDLVLLYPVSAVLVHAGTFLVQFVATLLLFSLIFKIIPAVDVPWRDVWMGASVSTLLFAIGKIAIGFYLRHTALTSVYGAAASLVILLVWVFYSTLILLFGAELTHAYAMRFGCLSRLSKPASE